VPPYCGGMKRCACLALAAIALAACGGGDGRLSKSGYESKLKSAFSAANAELGAAPQTAGSVELLTRIEKSYGDIANTLEGLHVPANVQALNDRLAAAASARADALKALLAKLEPAVPSKRQRLLAQYDAAQVGRDFDTAVAALTSKGYRFRPSAGT
jgi:hypothetical protein